VLPTPELIHRLAAPFRFDGSNGEAIVLVHGFSGNPAHFRHLGGQLNSLKYTINAPLLPGHATRFEDLGAVTRHDWIEATLDAVREVGDHHRIHLVGLSMGGLLSIVAADRSPVATLTTINSPIRFRDRRLYLARIAQFRTPEVRWADEPAPPLDDEVAEYWIHAEGFPTVAAAEMLSLSRYARRVARRVSIPSLVIQSRTDDTVHPSSGPLLKTALGTTCRLLWLENSIHNALFDSERDVIRDAVLELVGQ
jgi:carboxylesterase